MAKKLKKLDEKKEITKEELEKEIESGEDEFKVCSAIEQGGHDTDIYIIDKDGRKLRVKAKKIRPEEAVDDREGYN